MRIIEITKDFSRNGVDFKAGHRYVLAEDVESQFRSVVGANLGMSYPLQIDQKRYKGQDLTGKKLLTFRTGGIGDILFVNPVFRYLKKKFPTCHVKMASGCYQSLENLPEVDELHKMPFDAQLIDDADYVAFFQGIIETGSEKSKRTHAVDMFYSYFGIDSTHIPEEDKKPRLIFNDEERQWIKNECTKLGITSKDYVIGIQLETSAPLRNFPKDKMKMIVDVLAKEENVKIFLIGTAQQKHSANWYRERHSNVIIACDYNVRQSMVMADRYNLVISPDSFMVQVAGALEKPLIGLYGPFPSEVRMKYFKNAIALEPKVICSPCFKHDYRGCIKGFPSPCFSQVLPEDVLKACDYLKHKFTGSHFGFSNKYMQVPDLSDAEKYFLSADKGLCFFGGYYKHPNMIRIDSDHFTDPDFTDLNTTFERSKYPFVVFMDQFELKNGSLYDGAKGLVRPGGYFIACKMNCSDKFYEGLKRDMGKTFLILYSKLDPVSQTAVIVGRQKY